MKNDFVITRATALPLATVCSRLPEVATSHKFGVLATHNLREKMESKGVPFNRECRVIEACNPQQARDVLSQAIEISTALPCRISVYTEGKETRIGMLRPAQMLAGLSADPSIAAIAREVEEKTVRMVDDAR